VNRAAAAEHDTTDEDHRDEGATEQHRQRHVDDRGGDDAVDVVEAVAQHGDADAERHGDQQQQERHVRQRPGRVARGVEGSRDDGDREQQAGQGDPLELAAHGLVGAPVADHDRRAHQQQGHHHAEQADEREEPGHGLRQQAPGPDVVPGAGRAPGST
jgi:hypothetical protein